MAVGVKAGRFAYTVKVERIKKIYRWGKAHYDVLAQKKYTTIAGTLVFFLILSVVPFTFWLTLLFGKFLVDTEEVLNLEAFTQVKNLLIFLQENAKVASAGASFFLGVTSLYSASNFFYHLRRSGEIIYDMSRKKGGWKVRISALLLTVATMLLLTLFLAILVGMLYIFRWLFPVWLAEICGFFGLLFIAFLICWALNVYLCPFRLRLRDGIRGSVLTSLLWGLSTVGFSIYLRLSNLSKLYGAITAIVVFLLWAYLMMICFVVGVIYNEYYAERTNRRHKKF